MLTTVRLQLLVFFFQAEDGIRDVAVTGVQTCALPIFSLARPTGGTSSPPILHEGAEDTFSSSFDPTNSFIDANDGFTDGRKSCTLGESGFLRTPNCVGRDFIFVAWPL